MISARSTHQRPKSTICPQKSNSDMRRPSRSDTHATSLHRGSMPHHVLHHFGRQRAFLGESHLRGEGGVRAPLGRGPRGRLLQHPVHLFQREALGFRNQEVRVKETHEAERSPNEEHLFSQIGFVFIHQIRRDDANNLSARSAADG